MNIFPGSSDGKESICNVVDPSLIPALGRSPGGGHGNPLQYSFFFFSHYSILDRRIPRVEKPGGLQYMGLQRVRHD